MRTAALEGADDQRAEAGGHVADLPEPARVAAPAERGERVYLAMASRGYTGILPTALTGAPASRLAWGAALTVPALAAIGTALA
jgi:hypothetical protein